VLLNIASAAIAASTTDSVVWSRLCCGIRLLGRGFSVGLV
jgi:hypothetical protein